MKPTPKDLVKAMSIMDYWFYNKCSGATLRAMFGQDRGADLQDKFWAAKRDTFRFWQNELNPAEHTAIAIAAVEYWVEDHPDDDIIQETINRR